LGIEKAGGLLDFWDGAIGVVEAIFEGGNVGFDGFCFP
jgi:hypothetical protein